MITIRNTQRTTKINGKQLKKDTQAILDELNYSDFDIGILLVTDTIMQKYNKAYRDKDVPTDILSFPHHPYLKAGKRITITHDDDKNLGDLILAPAYIMHDLPRWNTTFEKHLQRLLVHGICHLLGYDHIEDCDYKVMHKKEMALLKKLQ